MWPQPRRIFMKKNFPARVDEVVAAEIADYPGSLAEVLKPLLEADVNITYMYSSIGLSSGKGMVNTSDSVTTTRPFPFCSKWAFAVGYPGLWNLGKDRWETPITSLWRNHEINFFPSFICRGRRSTGGGPSWPLSWPGRLSGNPL